DQLRERFRAVRIVFDQPARLPQEPPPDWFHLSATGNTLEFIDSRFSERDSRQRLNARFNGIRSIEAEPLALRTIFTSLARAVRNAA
ncbi:MAG: hypothetical protein ACRD19_10575, partial [Terriglobia bacterium]